MKEDRKKALKRAIEDVIYLAWLDEFLFRGDNAVDAHKRATAATMRRMFLLEKAWLTVDWLPDEDADRPAVQLKPTVQERLQALLNGHPSRGS